MGKTKRESMGKTKRESMGKRTTKGLYKPALDEMKKQICCGMETNVTEKSAHRGQKFCSCYGQKEERYLEMVHKADGMPHGSLDRDCGCQKATGSNEGDCHGTY